MTRKTYRDYPENYLLMVEHFSDLSAPELTFKINLRSALALRRDLYRFFAILAKEGDETNARLFPIARDISVSVRPQDVDSEDEVTLTIYRNPLTQFEFPGVEKTPTVTAKAAAGDLYSVEEIEAAMAKKREEND